MKFLSKIDSTDMINEGTSNKFMSAADKTKLDGLTVPYTADFLVASWTGTAPNLSITYAAATTGFATKALGVFVYEDGAPNPSTVATYTVSDTGDVVISSDTAFDGHVVISGISDGSAGGGGLSGSELTLGNYKISFNETTDKLEFLYIGG